MGAKIHFLSGKTLDISDKDMKELRNRFTNGGVRYWEQRGTGNIILLSSNTIEYVEKIKEEEDNVRERAEGIEESNSERVEQDEDGSKWVSEKDDDPVESVSDESDVQSVEETIEDKRKRLEAEMLAKSNCKHETQVLMYTQTTKGKRYFPVCTFCGKRDRYLSADKIKDGSYKHTNLEHWTVGDLMDAKPLT